MDIKFRYYPWFQNHYRQKSWKNIVYPYINIGQCGKKSNKHYSLQLDYQPPQFIIDLYYYSYFINIIMLLPSIMDNAMHNLQCNERDYLTVDQTILILGLHNTTVTANKTLYTICKEMGMKCCNYFYLKFAIFWVKWGWNTL